MGPQTKKFLLSMFVRPSVCHTICLSHIGHLQLPEGEGNTAEVGDFASFQQDKY